MTDQITATADVRDLARETIEELVKHFDETDPYMFCVEYHIADAILAALDAKGLTLCGTGRVAVSLEDVEFIVSHMWARKREAHDHAGMVQDRLKAALSAGSGQDGEGAL